MNSSCCPALWFVYILMHGKEECAPVSLGSQHKCVERPVRPVFRDYLPFFVTMVKFMAMHLSNLHHIFRMSNHVAWNSMQLTTRNHNLVINYVVNKIGEMNLPNFR